MFNNTRPDSYRTSSSSSSQTTRSGTIKNILIFIFVLVLLYIIYKLMTKKTVTSSLATAMSMQTITPATMNSTGTGSSNFAYSIWIYIDDWNYKYGEDKIIFGRMSGDTSTILTPCPVVSLSPLQNNLEIALDVFPGLDAIMAGITGPPSTTPSVVDKTIIPNIPIQAWVNIIMSVNGRSMDIYLDGKLVRTALLQGVANIDSTQPLYITPNGGFSGWTSKLQSWPNDMDPQQAWNIYKAGYGGSFLGSLFGKYTIKLSLINNSNAESSSLEV